nr:Agt2 [Streptomyces argenteolus]
MVARVALARLSMCLVTGTWATTVMIVLVVIRTVIIQIGERVCSATQSGSTMVRIASCRKRTPLAAVAATKRQFRSGGTTVSGATPAFLFRAATGSTFGSRVMKTKMTRKLRALPTKSHWKAVADPLVRATPPTANPTVKPTLRNDRMKAMVRLRSGPVISRPTSAWFSGWPERSMMYSRLAVTTNSVKPSTRR